MASASIGGKMPRTGAQNAASADTPTDDERYINRLQLRKLVPASDVTLWRWQRDPKIAFPAPVKLGADGRNYWWLPKIRAWMQRREERTSRLRPAPAAQQ
jgi:predicted DNA-binding transcriptional regulator AlpA